MEEFLVVVGLLFLLLPLAAILIANSARRDLRQLKAAMETETEELRAAITNLRRQLAERGGESIPTPSADTGAETARQPEPATETTAILSSEPLPEEPPSEPEEAGVPDERTAPKPQTTPPSRPPRLARPPRPPKHTRTKEEWEDLVGGRLLNRIGAVALIIGVGFFLKYAFDREWITETMRAILGGALGLTLLLIGYRSFRKGFQVFSQGLVGAGIAVLYLSVYAAFNFYNLGISQTSAFVMMAAVTVIAFQQAFQYNSVAVSLLGLIGGFLTPIMLSSGQANHVGLFTYIAILDAGILAIVAVRRSWGALEPLALFGTWVIYWGWVAEYYAPANRAIAAVFVTIFWGLFFALDLYRAFSAREPIPAISHIVAMLNAGLYYLALYILLGEGSENLLVILSIALGIIYFLPTLLRRGRETSPFYAERSAVAAMILFALAVGAAPGAAANDYLKVIIWGIEALGFFWLGARWKFPPLWGTALLLFGFTLAMLGLMAIDMPGTTLPIIMLHRVELMEGALALLIALGTIPARSVGQGKSGGIVMSGFQLVSALLLLLMLTGITDRVTIAMMPAQAPNVPGISAELAAAYRLDFIGTLVRALVWLGYALLLLGAGLRKNWRPLVYMGLGIFLLGAAQACIGGLTYRPIESFIPLLNLRAGTLLALMLGTIAAARMLSRNRETIPIAGRMADILRIGAALLVFELLTVETYDYFNAATQAIVDTQRTLGPLDMARIEYLGNMEQLAISGAWLLYSALLMVIGFLRRARVLRIISFALFGLSIVKIFAYDLSFLDTLYRIFSFIGLGVILISISYLYTRYKEQIFGEPGANAGSEAPADAPPPADPQ